MAVTMAISTSAAARWRRHVIKVGTIGMARRVKTGRGSPGAYDKWRPAYPLCPPHNAANFGGRTLTWRHSLVGKLLDRLRVLGKVREAHPMQHVRRLGELDIVVSNDLEAIAPGIAEVEEWSD
jgi:hypothetical protein